MAVAFVKNHIIASVKTLSTNPVLLNLDTIVPAGNTLVARFVFDNAGTAGKPLLTFITTETGETNSWVFLGAARSSSTSIGSFASAEVWAIKTTVAWNTGTLGVIFDTAITMKACGVQEFSGVTATLRSTSGTNYSTTTTAASATTTGTTPVIGDLAIGFIFGSNVATAQAGDTDTTGGAWNAITAQGIGSTGGNVATNNFGVGQSKVLTSASHQTLNNSAAMTAGNGAIVAILQAEPVPALTQAAYRFYADGTESGSTALAAQDTAPTVDVSSGDVNLSLRVRLQETNAVAVTSTDDFQLQWEKNASGTWTNVVLPTLLDSYPSSNGDTLQNLVLSAFSKVGQSFMGDGKRLVRAGFHFQTSSPDGIISAELYAHTGTFGTTGVPTGSPLATSPPIDATSVSSSLDWKYFDFDGTVTLTNGTPYCICLSTTNTVSNGVQARSDFTSPSHVGSAARYSGSWATNSADFMFEVYTASSIPTTAVACDSTNLTDAAATTNRLTGGSGSFVAGKLSEDGLVDNLGWTASNHTEVLYSVTVKAADVADNDTLRFRILRNGVTTEMTYTAVPTITIEKVAGPDIVNGTAMVSLPFSVVATGTRVVNGTATAALNFTVTATGLRVVSGTASAALDFSATATGTVVPSAPTVVNGTATVDLPISVVATGTRVVSGTATVAVDFAATATGTVVTPGTVVSGTAQVSLDFGVLATGTVTPVSGGGSAPTWISSTYDTGSTGTSTAMSTPVLVSDVALVAIYAETDSAVTPPDGTWTERTPIAENNTSGKEQRLHLFWRRVTSAGTPTYTFTHPSAWTMGTLQIIRDAVASGDPFDGVTSAVTVANSLTCPSVSLTTTVANTLLVWFSSAWDGSTATPPTGMTERLDITDNITAATLAKTATGSTGTLNGTRSVNSSHCSWLVAIKPVATAGPTIVAGAATVSVPITVVATGTVIPATPTEPVTGLPTYMKVGGVLAPVSMNAKVAGVVNTVPVTS